MKKPFLLLCLVAIIISGCVSGLEGLDRLVQSYDNAPWTLNTKVSYQEKGVEIESFNAFTQMMSGFGEIDQFIELCTYHPGNRGKNYQKYNAIVNSQRYEELSKKHNDTVNPPVSEGAFYLFPQFFVHGPFSATDFVKLEVTSTEAFDEGHPAGSSLLDLLHYATTTPNRVLRNNYQFRFDTDVIVNEKDVQLFNTYKPGTDVRPEDMAIINYMFLSFDKLPEPFGPRNIRVHLTADDGTILTFITVLTFGKVN